MLGGRFAQKRKVEILCRSIYLAMLRDMLYGCIMEKVVIGVMSPYG